MAQGLFKRVKSALRQAGVSATVHETAPGIVDLDSSVGIEKDGEEYCVFLIDPDESDQEHGRYQGPEAFEIAVSEAVEHVVRHKLLGEHVPAGTAETCEYEDCDADASIKFIETGQKFCDYHGAVVAILNLTPAEERVLAIRDSLSVPEWRKFKRACAKMGD